jgi:hypothetical protein
MSEATTRHPPLGPSRATVSHGPRDEGDTRPDALQVGADVQNHQRERLPELKAERDDVALEAALTEGEAGVDAGK